MSVLGTLLRMRLRRDRWQLTIWLAVISFIALIAVSATEFHTTYATAADREAIVRLRRLQHIAAAGPGCSPGHRASARSITFQILAFAAFLAAVMTSMLAVRHVRGDEEAGRSEIVGASRAGRFAPTVATLVEGLIASVAVGLATTLGLLRGRPPGRWLARPSEPAARSAVWRSSVWDWLPPSCSRRRGPRTASASLWSASPGWCAASAT